MKPLYNATVNGQLLSDHVKVADHFFERLIGLLRHKQLAEKEALLITHCRQVHTFGMRFPIDAVFLSAKGEILFIEHNMHPWRISKYVKNARQVLELMAETAKEYALVPGNEIRFEK